MKVEVHVKRSQFALVEGMRMEMAGNYEVAIEWFKDARSELYYAIKVVEASRAAARVELENGEAVLFPTGGEAGSAEGGVIA